MAATRTRNEPGTGISCLDLLTTPGFVWGATGMHATQHQDRRDACARGAESPNAMPLGMLLMKFKI